MYLKILPLGLLVIFYASCNNYESSKNKPPVNKDVSILSSKSADKLKKGKILYKDTVVLFLIEGLSAEGSEVKVHYINDTIRTATWNIYGETGQSVIYYEFLSNGLIKASEKNFIYRTDLNQVSTDNDMVLKNALSYLLDTNGVIQSEIKDKDFVNVFMDFKQRVPLTVSP